MLRRIETRASDCSFGTTGSNLPMKKQQRVLDLFRLEEWGTFFVKPCGCRERTDQGIQVVRFKLERTILNREQVHQGVTADPRLKEARKTDKRQQNRKAASTSAFDRQAVWIYPSVRQQALDAADRIFHIINPPVSMQRLAVSPAISGAAPVIDCQDGIPPAGQERITSFKTCRGLAGRSPMNGNNKRRQPFPLEGGVGGLIKQAVDGGTSAGFPAQGLWDRVELARQVLNCATGVDPYFASRPNGDHPGRAAGCLKRSGPPAPHPG